MGVKLERLVGLHEEAADLVSLSSVAAYHRIEHGHIVNVGAYSNSKIYSGIRMENHSGGSNKFYESSVIAHPDGSASHVIRYGSTLLNHEPTELVGHYDSMGGAIKAHSEKIQDKVRGGYVPTEYEHVHSGRSVPSAPMVSKTMNALRSAPLHPHGTPATDVSAYTEHLQNALLGTSGTYKPPRHPAFAEADKQGAKANSFTKKTEGMGVGSSWTAHLNAHTRAAAAHHEASNKYWDVARSEGLPSSVRSRAQQDAIYHAGMSKKHQGAVDMMTKRPVVKASTPMLRTEFVELTRGRVS